MSFRIEKIGAEIWKKNFSELAHKISFQTIRKGELERIDYALLLINHADEPVGYMTCRELDAKTVYWQFGGAMPNVKDTIYSFAGYKEMASWHLNQYDRIYTYIENTNTVMLKMAMKVGFLITGIKFFDGSVMLEHSLKKHAV